jgi:peptide/nickel transport system substrate-binding protein
VDAETSFGRWLKQRRKALDLTQEALARRVGCATVTIRKLEAGELRPSRQVAERLAEHLGVEPAERPAFIRFARGGPEALPPVPGTLAPTSPPQAAEQPEAGVMPPDAHPATASRRAALLAIGGLLALVLLAAFATLGLNSGRRAALPPATPAGALAPPAGRGSAGTLRIIAAAPKGAVATLNPHLGESLYALEPARLALEPLAAIGPDGALVPVLASEIPSLANGGLSADRRAVTWRLRPDVVWSDGTPFSAADVAFTYRYCADERTACITAPEFGGAERVEALDARTVRIVWERPMSDPYRMFVGGMGLVLQERQMAGCAGDAASQAGCAQANMAPVGTGPYVVRAFTPDGEAVFALNERYRDPALPAFAEVRFRFVEDPQEAARAVFERGEADYALGVQASATTLADLIELGRGKLIETPTPLVERLLLNFADPDPELGRDRSAPGRPHPFLADVRVRRALALAIDRRALAEELYRLGVPGRPTCELVVTEPYVRPDAAYGGRHGCDANPDEARALLEAAGWQVGAGGVRERDGTRLRVVLLSTTGPARERAQEILKVSWEAIGVAVELRSLPPPQFFGDGPDAAVRFPADALLFASGSDTPDQGEYLCQWASEAIPRRENGWSGSNFERFSSAEYDLLCAQLRAATDPDERAALTLRMNDLLVDEVVTVPLVARRDLSARAADLHGPSPGPWDAKLWNVAVWTRP